MSLHYLIDGYNVLHQMPELSGQLDEQRRHLILLIESRRPQGSERNQVTVVFDGRSGYYGRAEASAVRVIFSLDESADDKIRRMVNESNRVREIVVVTDDREIQRAVSAVGAKVEPVSRFLGRLDDAERKPRASGGKKQISKTAESAINQEMAKIWLNKSRDRAAGD
ncbi:MAG: NYN domain-containing protein [Candidatus Omnitrophica bacterium]|nr:NYN domain-containing protein [Candidatus Omnitrophota bacterium]